MNAEKIYTFFNSLITKENKVYIPKPNEYKRKYNYEKFTNEEDYIPYSKNDLENIIYNILNNGYDEFTFYCPADYQACSADVQEITSDTTLMSNISSYINPFNSYSIVNTTVSSYGEVYVSVVKKYSNEEIIEAKNKLNEIISNLELDGKSNVEKLKIFHNYLIKNTTYDEEFAQTRSSVNNPTKANGALINGYAVCSGYTDVMALFLDRLNIPNIGISSETHTWNLVYIDDEWLHIDATWNDTKNEKYDYEFYLIDTEHLLDIDTKQHTFDSNFFIEA